MNDSDITEGMKTIRSGERLKLIAQVMLMVSLGCTAITALILKPGSSAAAGIVIGMLISFILSLLLSVISLFRILKGCGIAGRADDNYNNARFILVIAMLANIASAALSVMSFANAPLFKRLSDAGAGVCEAIAVFFIISTTGRILSAAGETELSADSPKTIALIAALLVLGSLIPGLPVLLKLPETINPAAGVLGAVLSTCGAVIYLLYLNKAVKALAEL